MSGITPLSRGSNAFPPKDHTKTQSYYSHKQRHVSPRDLDHPASHPYPSHSHGTVTATAAATSSSTSNSGFGTQRTFSYKNYAYPPQHATTNTSSFRFPLSLLHRHDSMDDLSTRHVDSYDTTLVQTLLSYIPRSVHVVSDEFKFILNICMWYLSSSLTNNIGKQILTSFKFPVTLTFVQFVLVTLWCFVTAQCLSASHIRFPTQDIVTSITPLAVFLIVGHVFSSIAISRVPVSLVHTIKALAPLFTVLCYRCVFKVHYTPHVYASLLPLTLGVILACSFTYTNSLVGLSCALGSCFVFVTQNIFSKKLLFKEAKMGDRNPNKLDKINVLFYSSLISCLLMVPLWLYSDGASLLSATVMEPGSSMTTSQLLMSLFLNGTMNFGQNWFAFTTLSMTSPVTYSIFSLLKRIFVIVMSIVWFGQQVTVTQSLGILMTFVGLWMYQRAKQDVDKGEMVREKALDVLPTEEMSHRTTYTKEEGVGIAMTQAKRWASALMPLDHPAREGKSL